MSKVIKGNDTLDVLPFDFRAIEDSSRHGPLPGKGVTPIESMESEGDGEPDPLAELEATIQRRLLEIERKSEELEKEAYEQGFAQGEKDGFEFGMKSVQIVREHLERIVEGLENLPEKAFENYREWFITNCMAAARHVVQRELAIEPDSLIRTIRNLLDDAREHQSLTLFLNPADLDLIRERLNLFEPGKDALSSLSVKPDDRLKRGGCRLESEIQLLDATIDTQFAQLEKALRDHASESD